MTASSARGGVSGALARIDIGGVSLEYERVGSRRPLLVVSPSWWPVHPWHTRVVDALGGDFELTLFHHRGVGGSDAPADGYTVPQFAADAAGLARVLGYERVHVLGFAIGGATALVLARDFPDLVASVASVAAGGPTPPERAADLVARARAAIAEVGYERYIRAHATRRHQFSPGFLEAHPEVPVALADALWRDHASEEVFPRHVAARATYDFGGWIERLDVPVLVAVGAEDLAARGESTPIATARELAGRLPRARLQVFPRAGHLMPWQSTDAFAAALRTFVTSVDSA